MSLFNRISNMFNTKSGQGGDGDFSGGHIIEIQVWLGYQVLESLMHGSRLCGDALLLSGLILRFQEPRHGQKLLQPSLRFVRFDQLHGGTYGLG